MAEKTSNVVSMEEHNKIAQSMAEIEASNEVEYKLIDGFKDGQFLEIGSLTAGDLIEWQEANEGVAKRTAGLRLICKSLVGPMPDRVRYANETKNIEIFRRMNLKRTEKIVKEILDLNGMTVQGQENSKKD